MKICKKKVLVLSLGVLVFALASVSLFSSISLSATGPVIYNSDNLIYNPTFELSEFGASPDGWLRGGYGTNSASHELVNEDGRKSVKVTISNYVDGDAKWYFSPITVEPGKQYRFSVRYKSNVTPFATVVFDMADGTQKCLGLPSIRQKYFDCNYHEYSDTFIAPAGSVKASVYFFIKQDGWLQTNRYSLREYAPVGFERPLLTITFDDGHEVNVNTALPIMNEYGIKSTQFFATTFIEDKPQSVLDGVLAFSQSGHEIGSHSVSHPLLTATNSLDYELEHSRHYLEELTEQPVTSFASPFGDYDYSVISAIEDYYVLHRSVDEGYNTKDNLNIHALRVQNVLSTTSAQQITEWVNQAQSDNTWLILVYHRVTDSPGFFDTPVGLFEQHVQTIIDSGITVKTLSDAYSEICYQL